MKQSIWKIISGEGEIKADPVSVELSGANNTTTVTYAAEVDNGQLKFSLVYPHVCQNNPNQIIGINLFLKERQPQVVDSTRKMDAPPFDYTSSLYLYFKKGSSHVDAWKYLEYLNRNDLMRDQVDAKYEVQRNASGIEGVSDAAVYLEYSEMPA